jgi:hypothetical protein
MHNNEAKMFRAEGLQHISHMKHPRAFISSFPTLATTTQMRYLSVANTKSWLSHNQPVKKPARFYYNVSGRTSQSALYMASAKTAKASFFQEGDEVQFEVDGKWQWGIVQGRKGGWYSIQWGDQVIKKRADQVTMVVRDGNNGGGNDEIILDTTGSDTITSSLSAPLSSASETSCAEQLPPPPTIIDLDAVMATQQLNGINEDTVIKPRETFGINGYSQYGWTASMGKITGQCQTFNSWNTNII